MKNRISIALISCLTTWFILGGIAFGATLKANSANSSVKVGSDSDFTFYLDPAADQPVINVSLPDVLTGGVSTFTVYLKNSGAFPAVVSEGSNSLTPSTGKLTLTFDGQPQEILQPGGVAKVVGTFITHANTNQGNISFTFSVKSALLPTTLTTPAVTAPSAPNPQNTTTP